MKLLRNPEVKNILLLYGAAALAATILSFVWEIRFGLLMLAVCVFFTALHLYATGRRYQRISNLAADIDQILHGDRHISIANYTEGELGILQSEIYKMTVRLHEQQQHLREEKIYLSDSLADISHQIRTPLTSINLLVSLLSKPDIDDAQRQQLSRELFELLSRIDWLITALLKISKLDAGTVTFQTEQAPLSKLLEKSAAPVLVPMDLRNQTLKISAEGTFAGDFAWTCEALTNILKNCMEHTPSGGTIAIDASSNALYAEIIVLDDGSGIAAHDLPHIFERFYKGTDSDDQSFGIGLALARMIIAAQNGTIKAENRMQGGAKFTIRFYKGTV